MNAKSKVKSLRNKIDKVDEKLLILLAERQQLASGIGEIKKRVHILAFDNIRWQNVEATRKKYGKTLGLSENFVTKIYKLIHAESLKIQKSK